ncbi:hypothetical protein [Haloferax volcanii]|uniref:Uncharacterized protein n=1 Tax=Haloferax volcanii JCM 10717 TaxID=1227458 RepID=M0ICI1_HALVO|nr:hypothetical protein [Haloferax alexandrinus]ELZ93543.1 hypothetical protein C452_04963 [Haloferax alexandrinus JCM 10717]
MQELTSKAKKAVLGGYAGAEGIGQLLFEESIIGYATSATEPGGTLLALLVLGLGVSVMYSAAQIDELR